LCCNTWHSARSPIPLYSMRVSQDINSVSIRPYGESCTHAYYLHRAFENQELACHELHEVASVIIVDHMEFIKHNDTQVRYGTGLDRRVYKCVGLQLVSTAVVPYVRLTTFSMVQIAISTSDHVARTLLPPKKPTTRTEVSWGLRHCGS